MTQSKARSKPTDAATPLFSRLKRGDPMPWLLASDEPQARFLTLAHFPIANPGGLPAARKAALTAALIEVRSHPATKRLLAMLPAKGDEPSDVSGHNKPELVTNVLDLLAEIGLTAASEPRISRWLNQVLSYADAVGRFQAYAVQRSGPAVWGCLACDTHAIADAAGRLGVADDPRVRRALDAAHADLIETDLGLAWGCPPDPTTGFRGPGRRGEPCPQATLEALRAFSWLPLKQRPNWISTVVHTVLETWRQRGTRKPYMMGHGRQFKTVKWPPTWYGAYEIVDVLGRLPETWRDLPGDRRSLAEIAACLLAYNVAVDGTVTPQSAFQGWEWLSFGQKKQPSALATAMVWTRLAAIEELAGEIAAVDVLALASSKGGTGTVLPPKIG
jgi:hypothetical protein